MPGREAAETVLEQGRGRERELVGRLASPQLWA